MGLQSSRGLPIVSDAVVHDGRTSLQRYPCEKRDKDYHMSTSRTNVTTTMSDWDIGYDAAMNGLPCPDPANEDMGHGHTAGEKTLWRLEDDAQ